MSCGTSGPSTRAWPARRYRRRAPGIVFRGAPGVHVPVRFAANDDRSLATTLFTEDLDEAIDFGDDRGILWLASFEDFGDSRQTTGDVLNPGRFTRRLGDDGTPGDFLTFFDLDVSSFGQVVDVQRSAVGIFQHDLRVQVTLVVGDDPAFVTGGVFFDSDGFAFDDVFKANTSRHFGENRNTVRIPLAQGPAGFDFLILFDRQNGTGRNFELLELAALRIENRDFTVSREDDRLTLPRR